MAAAKVQGIHYGTLSLYLSLTAFERATLILGTELAPFMLEARLENSITQKRVASGIGSHCTAIAQIQISLPP